ncbi:hypothetical protein RCG39_04930 [Lactococcus petauri]|uniref:hypothetical protein n=1 Tax=Lactococcus petauri TaxID=1940789 RepID=UPI0027EA192B|nr:hypothetical protein [Lactococcus petauri]MDQ7119771.1 hypothetical protein [Lactococcus petauri]MDQ7125368.1 hypothetical protein [Lactococcus petauri]MDQ7126347.1 hypothetical protein [Lactococcus petauri]MDQ7128254.1 hypothetical protein [Lactococcus petauri]MDQ7138088.1 hypothetical protein [Lactococcus petauri]
MSDFNQDIENLLNAYDSNWDDYLILREQFIEKYSLSVEKLQEQLNTAKKYIEHVIGTIKHDGHLGTIQTDWILPYLEKALAAIGGDDD